ncbi:MAG: hypothetical protein JSR44_05580 [Spirochaetes bacterium]|nr:hypothetical protein [Spirochaetota bacterium]
MKSSKIIGIFLLLCNSFACRSTPGELKREPFAESATSAEALVARTDEHQNRLNMLLNSKAVDATPLIEDFRQATLYLNKQPSQIRPMTIGAQSGILLCRFEQGVCRVISTPEEFTESTEAPLRRTILQAIETGGQKNAIEIGRTLAKADKSFASAIPLESVANKKNAAAAGLGLLESNSDFAPNFMALAASAYPHLEFAQNIGGMDRDEVQATSAKLSRFKTKDDVVLTKYVGILKQVGKDRLLELAAAERAEQEAERAKAAEEAATRRRLQNFCSRYCLECKWSQRNCVYIASQQCGCW